VDAALTINSFPLPLAGRGQGWGSRGETVTGRRSPFDSRTWALRDRGIVPRNRIRAHVMRRTLTDAERRLWWHLRHRLALSGTHFRRQVHLGAYIVDFASHSLKLVIELDGGQHALQVARDAKRTKFLESKGYRVLRFWNNDVLQNINGVLEVIQNTILSTPTPIPSPQGGGEHLRANGPANA
jgi:very-short-patch-repair endonuclease